MTFMQAIRSLFSSKASAARIAMSVDRLGQPVATPSNYAGFSKEGYAKNAIVYRCIRLIATSCAGIKWDLYTKGRNPTEIEEHPLLKLIDQPNPMQSWSSLIESYVAYLSISGNSYLEAVGPSLNQPPKELWSLRPDLMRIKPNALGMVGQFCFKSGSQEKYWDVDPITGKSAILHTKTFNPIDIWYGMSPMEAAILGVDQYNHSNRWNLALLQNSASPSGIFKVETSDANPSGSLTAEQYARLKYEIGEAYQGAKNAGRPMLLEGGASWQSISLSPKEMEWLRGREVSGIDICNVYGVPAMMLGFGQMTYSNYKEARQAFYEDTIIPIMSAAEHELNRWLVPMFGDGVELKYDKDSIEALIEKREAKFAALNSTNFLMQNEKRVAAGYDEIEGWDVFVIGNQILANPDDAVFTDPTDQGQDSEPSEGDTEDGEEEISEESSEDEETSTEEIDADEESEKGWKSFNLLNRNEKQSTWRRVNARRKRLQTPFARSLEADLQELATKLGDSIKDKDPKLAEYAMNKVIDDGMKDISKTLTRYIKFTVEDFGLQVFANAKSQLNMLETKKNEKTWNDWADRYVTRRTGAAIKEIEGTTRKQVRRFVQDLTTLSISEDGNDIDMARSLTDAFKNLSPGRARTIARTEVAMASNSATIEAAKSLEVPGLKKEWVSLQDDRARDGGDDGNGANHLDMNGVTVELDDKFTVPPDADMEGPGDESGGVEQVANCRCTLIFKTGLR